MSRRHQVIIVGGGPVGSRSRWSSGCAASPACWWSAAPSSQRIPKGQNLTQRTLEHFYFWGIVDELRAAR